MKRFYTLIGLFSLLFTMVSPAMHPVAAGSNNEEDKVYADGEYELPFVVWQADKDEISVADGYLEKPATLSVEDGEYTVRATLKNDSWWQYFKTETTPGTFTDVTIISEDEEADTSVVEFKVQDIDEILDAKIHVIVEMINYDNHYDIRFNFDTSAIPVAEDDIPEEEPEIPEEEPGDEPEAPDTPVEDPEENPKEPEDSVADIEDGVYEIPFEVWQADKDEVSVADDYLEKPATVTVEDGIYTIEATLKNSSWWQYFKVASGDDFIDVTEISTDEATDTSVVQFEVEDLDAILDAKVHIIVTGIPGFDYDNKYDIRFTFDTSNLPLNEEGEDPVEDPEEDPEEPGKEPEDPEEDPTEDTEEDPVIPEDPVGKYKNGEYDLPFIVWQADKDEVSVADDYLEHPAKLIVEDGKYTVQTTLKNSSWWQYFKVEFNGAFVDVTEVSRDAGADTSVVQFEVEDIDAILGAKVHIIVTGIPGFDYDNKYDIRFNFDTSSIPVNEGHTPGKPIVPEDPKKVDPKNDTKDDELPPFDRNDNGDKDEKDGDQGSGAGNNNPQTGDTAKIMLYALLLIGSLIPIVIQIRKKFVAS